VTADFNGDGKLDLATANTGSNNVSVLLGNGAGGFGAPQQFAGLPYLHSDSLAVADFNGDTKPDLVAAGGTDVYILKGNGDGTFQSAVRFGGPGFWTVLDVAAGDFNGDNKMDLGVTETDDGFSGIGGAIYVLLGNGQGGVSSTWFEGEYPRYGLSVADLNRDGKLDVATAGYAMLGNGSGALQESWIASWASNPDDFPRAATLGDLTGDGIPDLVTAGYAVSVGRGLGGSFNGAFSQLGNGPFATAVSTGDFNGDGKLDVVTTDSDADVWLGNGDGTMASFAAFAVGLSPAAVAVGDFNGDGRPDAAVANANSNSVSVLLNDGDWGQPPPPPPPPPAPPKLSVSDATVTEGNTSTRNATFTLTLSTAAAVDVSVNYNTANISAVAGSDYNATAGSVVIPAGQTSGTFTVAVKGDRLPEPSETFAVNLSSPSNATISDAQGIATILDDEPRISINNVSKAEGNSTTTFSFTVSLSAAYDQAVTVNYGTASGTAKAGSDYTSKTGSVTFAPGETIKTITIVVKGDRTRESNETFFVDLFGPSSNTLIGVARGTGTILDDDSLWRSLRRAQPPVSLLPR
jgi:Calx-beta domain/FG-GAP-like repeat